MKVLKSRFMLAYAILLFSTLLPNTLCEDQVGEDGIPLKDDFTESVVHAEQAEALADSKIKSSFDERANDYAINGALTENDSYDDNNYKYEENDSILERSKEREQMILSSNLIGFKCIPRWKPCRPGIVPFCCTGKINCNIGPDFKGKLDGQLQRTYKGFICS